MSQRVKRPNRSDDGSVPAKRRKRPTGTPPNTISASNSVSHHYNNSSSSSSLHGGGDHNSDNFLSSTSGCLGASSGGGVDEEACSSKGGCPSKMAPPQSDYGLATVQQQSWRHLHELKSIYNRTSGCEATAPAELFRKDLISAMKLPDSEPLSSDEYWVIVDQWKQEWERGVQVPVNPDSLPEPSVTVTHCGLGAVSGSDRDRERQGACGRWYSGGGGGEKDHQRSRDFKLPKNKYIRITPFDPSIMVTGGSSSTVIGTNISCVSAYDPTLHHLSNAPQLADAACHYDLDDCDTAWLKLLNAERAACSQPPITAEQLERVLERLEVRCWDRIQSVLRNEEGLGIEYDETVICDVCRSPDSEEGNEMVFCDSCNICVHQACYGITRIPDGQWLCCTCGLGRSRPECVLCPNKGGAMKSTKSGQKWAHVSCALWIPEVSIGCVEKMEPITKISSIPQSRWALICVLCRDRVGACIQCSVKTCKTAYHVTCAFKHGLEMRAIIEDENADDGVKLRSYCEKHSKSSKKEKSVCSSSEDDDCKRKKRKDMTSEEKNQARAQRSQEIEAEFYKHVSTKDIAVQIEVDADALQFIYNYWKLKRKAGHSKPLLPPKSEDNDILNHQQEQADLEKMKMFVQLRQDLERVRNLCYMVSRREKISRTFIRMREQTFYKQVNVIQSAQGSLPATVFEAVLGANHAPSIYDILYSHDKADESTMDFNTILARIAGIKSPPPIKEEDGVDNQERKADVNGLFKDVKNNPYKKLYFNGSSKRRSASSLYGSGLSSAASSSDEQPKANKENQLLLSSSEDDVQKNVSAVNSKKKFGLIKKGASTSSVKKRYSMTRGKPTGNSSSEEDIHHTNKHHSGLKQIENELSVSNSDSDELILISSKSLNMKKAMNYIYSDSDSTDASMKNDDRSSNADSQQSSRLRTKAAMKDFSIKMAAAAANKGNTTKCSPEVVIKSVSNKNSKVKAVTSTKKDINKQKSNSSYVPSDLIVPQRQAAKKASENLKTSKDRLIKDIQPVAASIFQHDHDVQSIINQNIDVEPKLSIITAKPKVKGRPSRRDKSKGTALASKEEPSIKSKEELKVNKKAAAKQEQKIEDDLDKEVADAHVAYVPQRQAAKKAAEHIKSGLGKPQGNIESTSIEKDIAPKKDLTSDTKSTKKDFKEQAKPITIPAKIDSKRKSSTNSTSSSSKSSSSDSSTTSSSDSDNDDSTHTNGRPTPLSENNSKQRSSTCETKDNWPFLDKAAKSAASSSTSSSSSDSNNDDHENDEESNRRRSRRRSTYYPSVSPSSQPLLTNKRKADTHNTTSSTPSSKYTFSNFATTTEKADNKGDPNKQKSITSQYNQISQESRQRERQQEIRIPSISPDKSRQSKERRSPPREEPTSTVPTRSAEKITTARGNKTTKPMQQFSRSSRTTQRTTSDRLRNAHVRSGTNTDSQSAGPTEESIITTSTTIDAKDRNRKITRGSRKSISGSASVEATEGNIESQAKFLLSPQYKVQTIEEISAVPATEESVSNDVASPGYLEKEILERKADRVCTIKFKSKIDQIFTDKNFDKILDGHSNSSPIRVQNQSLHSPVKETGLSPKTSLKSMQDISTNKFFPISNNTVPSEVTPLASDHLNICNTSTSDTKENELCSTHSDELEDIPFNKEDNIKQSSSIGLFSPQLHKDQDLMADFDNILDDGFGIGKEYNTMKTCLSFNLGYAQSFKEDSKEDSARETLNLVEKLRLELSKKSTSCDVDDSISVASSTNKENDRLELCEQIVPNHILESSHSKDAISKAEEQQVTINTHNVTATTHSKIPPEIVDEIENYNKFSSCAGRTGGLTEDQMDVGKDELNEETHQAVITQADESWVPPSGNYPDVTDLNSIKTQFTDTIPTIIEPFVVVAATAQRFQQTPTCLPPHGGTSQQQLDESMVKTLILTPDRRITQTPFLDPTSMDYTSMDIHPNAKWAEKRVMPSRRSSSSSAASISSRNDAEEENMLYKRQEMIMNHPIHSTNMDMGYGNFQPMEQQFPPFSEAPQFVSAPVSLFPSSGLNSQLPFPSPNTPIFSPSFGIPYPQHSVIESMPKPDDTLPFQTSCTAAFTSSEHNMALTAAMVNIRKEPTPPILQEEPIQTIQQDIIDPQIAASNDEMQSPITNNNTPNHVEPSPNPSLKSNSSTGKKSPSKPTRSSARFISQQQQQQQAKSPSKSPGKSPRQEGSKRGRGKGGQGRGAQAQSSRSRGRGRGRGRGSSHFNSQMDYDFNTIHNKLVGTVYDLNFDDDISKDNMADLRAMRERRRSIDIHDRGISSKEASESPKFQSPSQTYKNKSYNTDLRDLRPPTPIKEPPKVPTPEVSPVFPDIVQPVLPGPVDMRTYNSTFDTSTQNFAESNLVKFDSEPPTHIHDDYDYEFDKELQSTLSSGITEKVDEPPATPAPPEVSNIKVSLSDSRNQLKVKIKGPIANYTTNVIPPLPPVCDTMISAKMEMNSLCNNTMTSSMANSNSGTSNLRRMRKKELLRQYWTQDMNMDDPAGKAIGYPAMPVTPSINRTIITIPKAVASMTTIPTRDDYRDYRTGSDEFVETKHRKEKSRLSLSRELKQLDLAMGDDDRRRNSLSMIASGISSATMMDSKRRGRPPRNTASSSLIQQMPTTPKLKIKIAGNNIIGATASTPKDIEQLESAVDRIRPPKKRLSNIAKPSVEELMRASMKFRKQVVADFGEKKKKRDKGEKRRDKKKRKRDKHNMQIVSTETDTPTKLILRIGKKVDSSFAKIPIASDISINISRNSNTIINSTLGKLHNTSNSSDIIKRIFPQDPLALPTSLPNISNTTGSSTTALRLVRANKVTPIKLKLSRCQKGSGYIMHNESSHSVTNPIGEATKMSQTIVTIESTSLTHVARTCTPLPFPDDAAATTSPKDKEPGKVVNQYEQGPVVLPPPASHTDPPAPSSPPPLSVTGPPLPEINCGGGKEASVSVSVLSPVSLANISDSCGPTVSVSDGSSTIASPHIPPAAAPPLATPALPKDCEVR